MLFSKVHKMLLIACCFAGALQGKVFAPTQNPWSASVTVGEKPSAFPSIALDDKGNAIAVWTYNGSAVMASERPQGGSWETPLLLSDSDVIASEASVAVDRNGNALATWLNETTIIVECAYLQKDAKAWSMLPAPFSSNDGNSWWISNTLFDSKGNALVAWGIQNDEGCRIRTARLSAVNLQWTLLDDLVVSLSNMIQLAIDDSDRALMVWRDKGYFVNSARLDKDASAWSAPMQVSSKKAGPGVPHLAVDKKGNAVAVWTNGSLTIGSARLSPTSSAWELISSPSGKMLEVYGLKMDKNGTATILWDEKNIDGGANKLASASLPLGANTWSPAMLLESTTDSIRFPQLSIDNNGNALAAWKVWGENIVIKAALRKEDNWSSPLELSKADEAWGAQAITPSGDLAVIMYIEDDTLKAITGIDLFKQ